MRELLEFEKWANTIVAEAGKDRPIPIAVDIQRQAEIKFPDRSPEQAMSMFVADKLATQEKLDYEQNKVINAQKRENDKLRRSLQDLSKELHDHENQAQQTELEVQRLKDLSAKLKPAGEIQQSAAKASADKIEKMLSDLEKVRNNPSIDDKKFAELETKVQQMKSIADDKSIGKIQDSLNVLATKQGVSDRMFNQVMDQLSYTEQQLQAKEKRFQKSIRKNAEKIGSWGNKFAELDKEISNIKGVSAQLFQDFGQQASSMEEKLSNVEKDSNEILKRFKDKLDKFDNYEEYLNNTINNIEDAKSEISHNLELIRSLGKQDMATDVISKAQSTAKHAPEFDPELDQELNQEPEELGPELDLEPQDEIETLPDETEKLREDTYVTANNYSLEEKTWLETYLPKFVYLYKKLYPNDVGTIIDEHGLNQLVEDDMHLMYQYHSIISQKVVREKFDITHRRLVNAYKNKNQEQGSLFNESLIYAYENALNQLSQIRY